MDIYGKYIPQHHKTRKNSITGYCGRGSRKGYVCTRRSRKAGSRPCRRWTKNRSLCGPTLRKGSPRTVTPGRIRRKSRKTSRKRKSRKRKSKSRKSKKRRTGGKLVRKKSHMGDEFDSFLLPPANEDPNMRALRQELNNTVYSSQSTY